VPQKLPPNHRQQQIHANQIRNHHHKQQRIGEIYYATWLKVQPITTIASNARLTSTFTVRDSRVRQPAAFAPLSTRVTMVEIGEQKHHAGQHR